MRSLLVALLVICQTLCAFAERNRWKPSDFEPLTSMPWKRPDAKLADVLDAIFREPDFDIRYPVLAAYLRSIPSKQLGPAFDICVGLEGEQAPDSIVGFLLAIWAQRDPAGCWERTQKLFHLVGIEDGWLGYDSWKERPRITVEDLKAIRASPYWITTSPLLEFPLGVNASELPKPERIRIMKKFANLWFERFGSWPGYPQGVTPGYPSSALLVIITPDESLANQRNLASHGKYRSYERPGFEMALRCWMKAEPASALEIIKTARETQWFPDGGGTETTSDGPSETLLMVWARADRPAMLRWAETLDLDKDIVASAAKGFLMNCVDAGTRKRWLAKAKSIDEKNADKHSVRELLGCWAAWDPKAALDAAVAMNDPDLLQEAVQSAAVGPWPAIYNGRHFGLGVIKDFNVAGLPKEMRNAIRSNWGEFVMESWGGIDIGETARHGLEFMLATDYAPKKGLLRFFGGEDVYPDEERMIDRTFCAMRVWTVVKPDEMKAWIATLKDAEMRKALTWLLQNPWGTGPEE